MAGKAGKGSPISLKIVQKAGNHPQIPKTEIVGSTSFKLRLQYSIIRINILECSSFSSATNFTIFGWVSARSTFDSRSRTCSAFATFAANGFPVLLCRHLYTFAVAPLPILPDNDQMKFSFHVHPCCSIDS